MKLRACCFKLPESGMRFCILPSISCSAPSALPQSPPSLVSAHPPSTPKAMFGLGIDKCLPQWGTSLPLCALNHISRVCTDVTQSKLFYSQVLGFVEIKRPQSLACQGAWLFNYGVGIHLISGQPQRRSRDINPEDDHLSFQADSLNEVQERLDQLGIPFRRQEVVEGGITIQQIFFHDPDCNMIEVCNCDCLPIQPLGAAPMPTSCARSKQQLTSAQPVPPQSPASSGLQIKAVRAPSRTLPTAAAPAIPVSAGSQKSLAA